MSRRTTRADGGFRELVDAAWREFKTTADVTRGIGEVMRATAYPPGGFVREELGFGLGEFPSLQWTMCGRAVTDGKAREAERRKTMRGADWAALFERGVKRALARQEP